MNNEVQASAYSQEATAYHEAAHAVMAFLKGCYIHRVEVFERPSQGMLGICVHSRAKYWHDSVWIALAGPVMDSIRNSWTLDQAVQCGGADDYYKVWQEYERLLAPRPKPEIREWIPESPDERSEIVHWYLEGWRPDDVHGQLKRKLTLYVKEYARTWEYIKELIIGDVEFVKREITENLVFVGLINAVASELIKRRKLRHNDIISICERLAKLEEGRSASE
ncbi:M50 family metallopeptidase [Pleomorphomonas sp. JP5]|uniref:M50 family metallopeptidase n=1 Tax=Pleomorphomonas sp. JP5 TaxID=2942998 RepID=UPI0020436608|nr:M50 family metallopeptidase [Pleomorphomonas sp. JP5]MCM5560064.1 M50 family metallopeptidase [Pleomorphomonas sp. JP5]